MKDIIAIYNKKRSLFTHKIACTLDENIDCQHSELCAPIAVIIPACNEYPGIFNTLDSLAQSIKKTDIKFSVVIVINNSKDALISIKQNNHQLIDKISLNCSDYPFNLKVFNLIDKMGKKQGVGYARRYGMDWAVATGAQVLACMDADTLVSENYATELVRFKKHSESKKVFALCQFTHQKVMSGLNSVTIQHSIDAYESYIKEHSRLLQQTGTPYWPYALGPTILCTANAYAAVGGMPIRIAGEDFYFVQALIKLAIQQTVKTSLLSSIQTRILDCTVYPAPRLSDRVPFGTGPVLMSVLEGKKIPKVYSAKTYNSIGVLIRVVHDNITVIKNGNFESILFLLPNKIVTFLENEDFFEVWRKLALENEKSSQKLETAFHIWFDGLKIMRLIHYLEDI
jgi:hypothetical protein